MEEGEKKVDEGKVAKEKVKERRQAGKKASVDFAYYYEPKIILKDELPEEVEIENDKCRRIQTRVL